MWLGKALVAKARRISVAMAAASAASPVRMIRDGVTPRRARFAGRPPTWVMTKLERLDDLLRRDPRRAKNEILKHLEGDLLIMSRPSAAGARRAETSGRAKTDSL